MQGPARVADDGRIKVWDADTGERIRRDDLQFFDKYGLDGSDHLTWRSSIDAVVSKDGKWVVSGGGDEQLFIWAAATGQLLKSFGYDVGRSFGLLDHVVIAPDKSWVAGATDREVRVWDIDTGELRAVLDATYVTCLVRQRHFVIFGRGGWTDAATA